MSSTPSPSELTEKQAERRQRVLDAAMELAREGGYEAVQMRDVAARADVALGTVYRYFASKDELLGAAWAQWTGRLEARLGNRPPRGKTRADRIYDFLRRATRALERDPKLTAALIMSMASPDPETAAHQAEVAAMMTRVVAKELEDFDPELQQGIREALGHIWYSTLVNWVNRRLPISRVYEVLERSTHLLIDPHDWS